MKRFVAVLLLLCLLCGCTAQTEYNGGREAELCIAYIPMDDRPVNTVRVRLLAKAAGCHLLMPDDALYRTALDHQPLNSNGTQHGDGEALLDWLSGCEADYYVLSLDQLLSGGLAHSRQMTDITDEYKRIDRLISFLEGKKAVLFDTVMRLSPTVGYGGCTPNEYHALRQYGLLPRNVLSGVLTADQVIAEYQVKTELDDALVLPYLAARARKLKLSEYLLNKAKESTDIRILYGIDDSHVGNTVHTNEVALVEQKLENGEIFAGTDELGMMSVTSALCLHYRDHAVPSVGLSYFGVDPTVPWDIYDVGALEETLTGHISALELTVDPVCFDVELLVYGGGDTEADRLLARYHKNLADRRPTAIIDLEGTILPSKILEGKIDLTCLLSYAHWNTAGNSVGIALSNLISRYLYLKYDGGVDGANAAFVQSLALSFAEDISYFAVKPQVDEYIIALGGDTSNFYPDCIDLDRLYRMTLSKVCDGSSLSFMKFSALLEGNRFLSALDPYTVQKMPEVCLVRIDFPWCRTFEVALEFVMEE